jgi:hypothetical protein
MQFEVRLYDDGNKFHEKVIATSAAQARIADLTSSPNTKILGGNVIL